ncbi:MAG: DUF6152 family protein [Steroidobacteraceae bacterium]
MTFRCIVANSFSRLSRSCKSTLVAVLAGALGLVGVAEAHHSFAMFDFQKTVTIQGTVKDFQWTMPHVWIDVIVQTSDGPTQYGVEALAIPILKGAGWTFNTLKPGDKVTIVLNPLRSGAPGGSLVSAELPDGRILGTTRRIR